MTNFQKHHLIKILSRIRMYVNVSDLRQTIGFLCGYDAAFNGEVLSGFREWYLEKYFEERELFGWPSLVEINLDKLNLSEKEKVNELVLNIIAYCEFNSS